MLALACGTSALLATGAPAAPARATAKRPPASALVLGEADFPAGATVTTQGAMRGPAIPAAIPVSSVYTRMFTNVRLDGLKLLSLSSSALVARNPGDTAGALSDLALVTRSATGRRAMVDEIESQLGANNSLGLEAKLVRARTLRLGDSAVELIFRFTSPTVTFQVAELWLAQDDTLSVLLVSAPEPLLSPGESFTLAKLVARRVDVALAPAPESTAPPLVAGAPAVGRVLKGRDGTWNTKLATFTRQWLRCNASGAGCTAIAGATEPTYTVADADRGATLVLSVTVADAAGKATARSEPTAAVAQ